MKTNANFPYELFESYFSYRQIARGTWCFNTCYHTTPVSSDAYLLIGNQRAIMIDCGMSKLNLKTYIDQLDICPVPIIGVIDTHSHFDHTACNGLFGHAFLHPAAVSGIRSGCQKDPEHYPPEYNITYVQEGDTIDLGGRILRFFEIPAHDSGSIAILDERERLLFTGDEVESGWMKLNLRCTDTYPGQTVEKHIANMRRLKSMASSFDALCPSHHGNLICVETLDDFITCGGMLLEYINKSYPQILPEHYDLSAIPVKERPQILMRHRSAHMGYFLGFSKESMT